MTDNENKPKLDPSDLITFKFTNKETGKVTETKMLKGTSALNWFYAEHPLGEGRIITEVVSLDPIVIRAEVWVCGAKVATGHANIDGKCVTLKRVETVAIRRALANAGYAADQIIQRLANSIGVDAAKAMLGSGKEKAERRMGTTVPQNHKLSELKLWALSYVYEDNEYHMNVSIDKLIKAGKLSPSLTLEEAKAVVETRHMEEAREQTKEAV